MVETSELTSEDRQAFQLDPSLSGHPDPYQIYAALLRESPVHWCEAPDLWVVLGYPESESLMRDPRCLRQDHLDKLIHRFGEDRIFRRQKADLPYIDGEEHTRLRHHVVAAFRGIDMAALDRYCTQVVNMLLDSVRPGEWFDLIKVLANPLPTLVTSELMGVPPELQGQVLDQVGHFVRARGLIQTEETAQDGDDAMNVYRHFFIPLLQKRRKYPRDDVISRLLEDPEGHVSLSDEQLLLIVASNFYSASIYTVPLLISNTAYLLAHHPEVFNQLRLQPSLVDSAVEEFLRYDPPAQALNVGAIREPVEIAGEMIPGGASLTALVGAANRDPRVFDVPDAFVVDRHPNPHLSFAPGIHQCLGLHLARLEMRAFLRALIQRCHRLEVDDSCSTRLVADRFRGFAHLTVRML